MAVNKWTVMSCRCSPADQETCSWIFFKNKATGLEVENLDDNTLLIKASFPSDDISPEDIVDLQSQFKKAGLEHISTTLKTETLEDQDWLSNWKKYFIPFSVGDRFLICPPWQADTLSETELGKRKKIIIDPAMAFGTGQHVTTKYCLHGIEKFAKGPRILDAGTGSGILSIASALILSSPHIVALDIDGKAIANAGHNCELNNVRQFIDLCQASPSTIKENNFDTILSNLTAEVIVELLPIYYGLLNDNGILILAGIIEERLSVVEATLKYYQWQKVEQIIEKGWVGMTVCKGSP